MTHRNRVKTTTTSTGTGVITVSGTPAARCRPLSDYPGGQSGVVLLIEDEAGDSWELSECTILTGTTFSRDVVLAGSNYPAKTNFAAGIKTVLATVSGEELGSGLVDPDDVGFDIVLPFGQSNMAGRGALDALIDMADSRVWQWGCDSAQTAYYQKIFSGADPLHMREGIATAKTGPATSFARAYAATIPTNRRVLLIPFAEGGTGLTSGAGNPKWTPGSPGGSLYENAIAQANLAIAAAQAVYPNSRFVGACMVQGENDAIAGVSQAVYATALKALIAGFRERITGAANSWFIIGGMVPERIAAYPALYNPIVAAHQQVAAETDKCAYTAGPTGYAAVGDTIHYASPGSRILGTRMALAVRAAQRYVGVVGEGSPTDTTAPALSSPTITATSSTTLSGSVSTTEDNGTLYYLASTSSSATAAAVKAGGSQAVTSTGVKNVSTTGQSANTAYYLHYLHTDAAGNDSAVASSASATTPAVADTTAPTLSSPTGTQTGSTTASGAVTTNEANGTLYFLASTGSTATAAAVKAGSTQAISSTGSKAVTVSSLTAATLYYLHFLHRDAAGNDSAVATSASFTTAAADTTAPVLSSPLGAQTGSTTASGGVTTNEANGTLYRYASTNATETAATVKAANLTSVVSTNGAQVVAFTGLTASTLYYAHYVHRDAAGNDSAVSSSASFTTAAAAAAGYTFDADTIGAAPAGVTVTGGVVEVVDASAVPGWAGKAIHFKLPKPATDNIHALKLDNIPVSADRTVRWKRGSAPLATARDAMVLRAHDGSIYNYLGARPGYVFQTSSTTNTVRLYKLIAGASGTGGITSIGASVTLADAASRWFEASCIGTTHTLRYSDDDGASWTTAFAYTDATYASGGVDYINGFGGSPDAAYIDDVSWS